MDFRNVKGIITPAGSLATIKIGNVVVWNKSTENKYPILVNGEQVDKLTMSRLGTKVQNGDAQTDYGIGAQIVVPYHDPWDGEKYKLPFDFGTFKTSSTPQLGLQAYYAIPSQNVPFGKDVSGNYSCSFSSENCAVRLWLNAHGTEHNLNKTTQNPAFEPYENKRGFLGCLPEDFIEVINGNIGILGAINMNFDMDTKVPGSSTYKNWAFNILNSSMGTNVWQYWEREITTKTLLHSSNEKYKRAQINSTSFFNYPYFTGDTVKADGCPVSNTGKQFSNHVIRINLSDNRFSTVAGRVLPAFYIG